MKYKLLFLFISLFIPQDAMFFNGEMAMSYLIKQCDFGPRFPGSEGQAKTAQFFEDVLRKTSDSLYIMNETIQHPYLDKEIPLINFFARYNTESENRILLMAHWDTREVADKDENEDNRSLPILGANDGASGVAVLLEIGNILKMFPLEKIGIDILLVDGEDMGREGDAENFGLGTQIFSSKIPKPLPKHAICLDMVADKEQQFLMEQYSLMSDQRLVKEIWDLANNLGYSQFVYQVGPAIIDDHYFLNKLTGIPAIDIIDFNYPNAKENYWHTLQDIPENCSVESLEAVGTVIATYIYHQDRIHP